MTDMLIVQALYDVFYHRPIVLNAQHDYIVACIGLAIRRSR